MSGTRTLLEQSMQLASESDIKFQTPVHTELTAAHHIQNLSKSSEWMLSDMVSNECLPCSINYVAVPWATLIDVEGILNGHNDVVTVYVNALRDLITMAKRDVATIVFTSCQHINGHKLFNLMCKVGIDVVYFSHMCTTIKRTPALDVRPLPLFAANVEDPERNMEIVPYRENTTKLLKKKRKYLYSFVGCYREDYMTDIRKRILAHPHNMHTFVKSTDGWHYDAHVYVEQRHGVKMPAEHRADLHKKRKLYNKILLDSTFSLCPSGTGPNTIRLWESLATGSIPVILSDTWIPPTHKLFKDAVIIIKEDTPIGAIAEYLKQFARTRPDEVAHKRRACIDVYNTFRSNFFHYVDMKK